MSAEPAPHALLLAALSGARATGPVPGILACDVTPERVAWLWPGRLARGKVTLLDGDPGLGKSTAALDLAARISRGAAWPDGGRAPAGGVVVLSAEDGAADTIVPRLQAASADLGRVRLVQTLGDDGGRLPVIPDDLEHIELAARDVEARLLVIDPLMSYLGAATDSHRDQDVRRALAPLAVSAERLGVAVLVVRHLTKAAGGSPLYRGGGSIGIIGAARIGLLAAREPEGEGCVLVPVKSNLGPPPPGLRFAVKGATNGAGLIEWGGVTDLRADQVLAAPDHSEGRGIIADCRALLAELLRDGPMPAKECQQVLAEQLRASPRSIAVARDRAGVRTHREGFGRGSRWFWSLPPGSVVANPQGIATTDSIATMEPEPPSPRPGFGFPIRDPDADRLRLRAREEAPPP